MSIALAHDREGGGPPLLLLHGIGHHRQAWRPVTDRLADAFDVVAADLPGFGRSAPLPPAVDPTIPAYAEAIARWLADRGIERPHVAGNSMGGAIALELGVRGVAASVTAFSPAGFWTPAERRFCQLSLGALARLPRPVRPLVARLAATRGGRTVLFAQLFGQPARMPAAEAVATLRDAWAAPAFPAALEAFARYRHAATPPRPGLPITVAWGTADRLLPYGLQAPRARRELPHARHLALGAGHVPFFDDPEAVAATIRATAAAASAR